MNAEAARAKAEAARKTRQSYVNEAVGHWRRSISLAADKGEFSVTQDRCPEVRDITSAEHESARAILAKEGYSFKVVDLGANRSLWECNW